MALDSKVAFHNRAREFGVSEADLTALDAVGVSTYSQYAFCCAYQPGGQNDGALFEFLEQALGARPAGGSAPAFRRLFFEAHALALQDLKSRLERGDSAETRILPLSEKVERVRLLRERLPGLVLTLQSEPSHSLIDKAVQQFEDNCIRYLEPGRCTSREQEILAEKPASAQLSFDSNGMIKVSKHNQLTECSVSGELKLRAAFTRRALAYELAAVASFQVQEKWANLLFERLGDAPPSGFKHVGVDQLLAADRMLWIKVSEETRAKVNGMTNGVKHVDLAIEKWSTHPEVQFRIMPLPLAQAASSSRSHPYYGPADVSEATRGKGFQKGGQGKDKGKWSGGKDAASYQGKIQVPEGCVIKFGDGNKKPICMKFNVGVCKAKIAYGKRCMHGFHVCWKAGCHKPVPASECLHGI